MERAIALGKSELVMGRLPDPARFEAHDSTAGRISCDAFVQMRALASRRSGLSFRSATTLEGALVAHRQGRIDLEDQAVGALGLEVAAGGLRVGLGEAGDAGAVELAAVVHLLSVDDDAGVGQQLRDRKSVV